MGSFRLNIHSQQQTHPCHAPSSPTTKHINVANKQKRKFGLFWMNDTAPYPVESEALRTYFLFRPRQIRVHPDLVATQSRERLRQC